MNLTILNRKTLIGIPSASGIEAMCDNVYIIGDDSPWLFRLNEKIEIQEKILISDIPAAANGKIPKPLKPDLEAMAVFGSELLLFGSGSKSPQRDVLIRINIPASNEVKNYSLVKFYDSLCTAAKLSRDDLNIEGAVVITETLYLFNRGRNRIFKISILGLLAHAEKNAPVPAAEIFRVTLPSLNGIEAGFSGATVSSDGKQIIFTASVENTPNWIDDGEILGSFVGIFPLSSLKDSFCPDCVAITDSKKNILKIKVESVAVHHSISANAFHLLLVTDNDGITSELIETELQY